MVEAAMEGPRWVCFGSLESQRKGALGTGSGEGLASTNRCRCRLLPWLQVSWVPLELRRCKCLWGEKRRLGKAPTGAQDGESTPDIFMSIHNFSKTNYDLLFYVTTCH